MGTGLWRKLRELLAITAQSCSPRSGEVVLAVVQRWKPLGSGLEPYWAGCGHAERGQLHRPQRSRRCPQRPGWALGTRLREATWAPRQPGRERHLAACAVPSKPRWGGLGRAGGGVQISLPELRGAVFWV